MTSVVNAIEIKGRRARLEQNPGEAVYGAIVVTAAIAASSLHETRAWVALVEATTTLAVFFAAHVHAGFVSRRFDEHNESAQRSARVSIAHQLPMLEVAVIPLSVLVIASLGLVDNELAIWIALCLGVVELFVLGVWLAERRERSLARAILTGVTYAAIGAVLVALKAAIH